MKRILIVGLIASVISIIYISGHQQLAIIILSVLIVDMYCTIDENSIILHLPPGSRIEKKSAEEMMEEIKEEKIDTDITTQDSQK